MAILNDIVATYKGPARQIRKMLARGVREDRALAYLMAGCLIVFVSQWPVLARRAHLEGLEMGPLLGGSLLAWVFIMPLVLYMMAGLARLVARLLGGKGDWYGARLALFWALLATGPLMLLNGLVAGFIGPGPQLTLVGAVWFGAFLWFWLSGMRVAETAPQESKTTKVAS